MNYMCLIPYASFAGSYKKKYDGRVFIATSTISWRHCLKYLHDHPHITIIIMASKFIIIILG